MVHLTNIPTEYLSWTDDNSSFVSVYLLILINIYVVIKIRKCHWTILKIHRSNVGECLRYFMNICLFLPKLVEYQQSTMHYEVNDSFESGML